MTWVGVWSGNGRRGKGGLIGTLRLTGSIEITLGEEIEIFFLPRPSNKTGSYPSKVGLLMAWGFPGSLWCLFSVVFIFSLALFFSLSSLMSSTFFPSPSSMASEETEEKWECGSSVWGRSVKQLWAKVFCSQLIFLTDISLYHIPSEK